MKILNFLVKLLNLHTILILIFLITVFIFSFSKIYFNLTPSMPYGFYIKSNNQKINHDDYISFCLDEKTTLLGLKYNYLEPGKVCNGSMPLIKQVIALPYESVYLNENYILVENKQIKAVTKIFDSHHRKLETFPSGIYKENCYWVLSDLNVANSWDSRYYGCIKESQIITKIRPMLIW